MERSELQALSAQIDKFIYALNNLDQKFVKDNEIDINVLRGSLVTSSKKIDVLMEKFPPSPITTTWDISSAGVISPITIGDILSTGE